MITIAGYTTSRMISENSTTAVYRAIHPVTRQQVVIKLLKGDHPDNEQLNRIRREYSLLSDFDSEYIISPYGLKKHHYSLALILEDLKETHSPLEEALTSTVFEIKDVLQLAIEISRALEVVHSNNIIYTDLNPANILISKDKRQVKLINFNRAVSLHDDRKVEPHRSGQLAGTLSYISPEQTGRLNTSIDHRTDLYALGVILFQLGTGSLPFKAQSPSELVHAHLAQIPPPPQQLHPAFPEQLSTIILKLLEKSPANRYLSCSCLIADLIRCREDLSNYGEIRKFEPGKQGHLPPLRIPKKLYSRTHQFSTLQRKLAMATVEESSVVLISGPSGVGKSFLVEQFHASLKASEAYFIQGRFEPVSSITPYSAIFDSVRQLISHILAEDQTTLNGWTKSLQTALAGHGAMLTDIISELELIIGPQDPLPELSPTETAYRFNDCFLKFFQTASSTGPPLVLFLDDLHLADPASRHFLELLLGSSDLARLMFIGTCRDLEDSCEDILEAVLSARKGSAPSATAHIRLNNLNLAETTSLLEDSLKNKGNRVSRLAEICFQKTGGNPFYLKQFLFSLYREGGLYYCSTSQSWKWDNLKLANSHSTRNVAELLIQRFENLSESCRKILKTASCIGGTFSLKILSELHGLSPEKILGCVVIALEQGFILQVQNENDNDMYKFAHDQIREAILSLFLPDECRIIRLRAGQFLLSTVPSPQYEQRLFEIAGHLNCGTRYLETIEEKLNHARVNLDAGIKARKSSDFLSAHTYLTTGLSCLPEKIWQIDDSLAAELNIEACETAFLLARYDEVTTYFDRVCSHSSDIFTVSRVYRIKIKALKARSQPDKAVETCREILSRLGVKIPGTPGRIRIYSSLLTSRLRLSRATLSSLRNLPLMTDRRAITIMGFLHDTGTAAYTSNPSLLPILCEHAIRLTLKYGNSLESSVIGYLTYGFLLCTVSERNIPKAQSFWKLAMELQEQLAKKKNPCQPTYIYQNFLAHWHEHLKNALSPLKTSIQGCVHTGDLDTATNAACSLCYRHYFLASNLDRTKTEIDLQHNFIERLNQQLPLARLQILRQAVANLIRDNVNAVDFAGPYFYEKIQIPAAQNAGDFTTCGMVYIIKLIHAVLFNKYRQAVYFADESRKYLQNITGSVFVPVFHFYDSLARLANYENYTLSQKATARLIITRNQLKLCQWANHAPQNYKHKYYLVEAEFERIRGNSERAMEQYDKAIHLAKENEYLQEEALAYECAARFYNKRGKNHIARPYMRESRYCYQRWGAKNKVRQLDDSLEWIIPTRDDTINSGLNGNIPASNTLLPGEGGSRLDMMTVIKASRILNSEMVLDELLKKMMRIMLECAGAQRGFLIFRKDDEWKIKVRGSIYRSSVVTLTDTAVATQNIASIAIINYVIHTAADVVLNDACKEGLFTNDSYILQKKPRSVLCMPIIHQGEIFCILYLENNLTTGAFPPDRQELLHLLGTQAAISLKNSRLFEELERTVKRMNKEVEKRRSTQLQLLHAEKLSALGRLSASIAHEFGNPLMGVKYLIEDFHKRETLKDNDRQLLQLGLEECERMKKLIQNLQRLNKPTTGKFDQVDIHKLIDNVLLFQKKHFSTNRIRLKKRFDHTLPQVDVIVDQITQVLFNLTMNSVDAMIQDGGILTVSTKKERERICIEVSDTGAGIAYEDQDRIFEPFYSSKTEEDGTGLGLSISYGIVKYHKGTLRFDSIPGEGTTFKLYLPAEFETAESAKLQTAHVN